LLVTIDSLVLQLKNDSRAPEGPCADVRAPCRFQALLREFLECSRHLVRPAPEATPCERIGRAFWISVGASFP
jgi:hypothetical protein